MFRTGRGGIEKWSQGETRGTCRPSRVTCRPSRSCVSTVIPEMKFLRLPQIPPPSRDEGSEVADDEVLEERLRRLIRRPTVRASLGGVRALLDAAAHVLEAPD